MIVTQGERTATLADTTDHWLSDDDSFALWLNTAFPPARREVPALVDELRHHGLTVDGQPPHEEREPVAAITTASDAPQQDDSDAE